MLRVHTLSADYRLSSARLSALKCEINFLIVPKLFSGSSFDASTLAMLYQ